MINLNKNFTRQVVTAISVCFLSVFLIGCFSVSPIYFENDKRMAEETVEIFHKLYNEKKYNEIYLLCTPKQQNLQTKEQFTSTLENLNNEAGKVIKSKRLKEEVTVKSSYRIINIFYETKFDKETRFEEFDILIDQQAKINFYGQPDSIE